MTICRKDTDGSISITINAIHRNYILTFDYRYLLYGKNKYKIGTVEQNSHLITKQSNPDPDFEEYTSHFCRHCLLEDVIRVTAGLNTYPETKTASLEHNTRGEEGDGPC